MLRVIYQSQTYWALGIYSTTTLGAPGVLVGVRLFLGGANSYSDPIPVSEITVVGGGSGGGLDAEAVQDLVAALLVAGSGITLTYNDPANTLTIAASGGGAVTDEQIDDRVAALLQAGSGITLTYNDPANTLTISASGGAGLTLEDVQDNLGTSFLVAGTGINLNYNDAANTLTLTNTAPYADESVDDRVAALLQAGSGITLTYNDPANTLTIAASGSSLSPSQLRWFIQGAQMRPNGINPTTTLDILDANLWIAPTNRATEFIRYIQGLSKRVNAGWAAGDGNGGLFTGTSPANNTWYGVYAMFNTTTLATDWGFSTAAADGTDTPSGWISRRVGWIRINASGQLTPFTQRGETFLWTNASLDVNQASIATTATLVTLLVPPLARKAQILANYTGSGSTFVWFTSPFETDSTPDGALGRVSLQANAVSPYGEFSILTNDTSQIRVRASALSATETLRILTRGWEDDRGQNNV